jgi:hypothetical protein
MDCVIQYCSTEADLVDDCVAAASASCDKVFLVVLTHFFTGEPDPEAWIKARDLAHRFKNVTPVLIQWKHMPGAPPLFWHHEARLMGYSMGNNPWVLFLDADEVIRDSNAFKAWWSNLSDSQNTTTAYKLANYWYFLSKKRRAKTLEDSVVLVKRNSLHLSQFRRYNADRENYFFASPEAKRKSMTVGSDGKPMLDHFSWVRSKDTLLIKTETWGHRAEKDWKKLIETAFAGDILTTPDFVHGYEYDVVET